MFGQRSDNITALHSKLMSEQLGLYSLFISSFSLSDAGMKKKWIDVAEDQLKKVRNRVMGILRGGVAAFVRRHIAGQLEVITCTYLWPAIPILFLLVWFLWIHRGSNPERQSDKYD